MCVIGVGRGWGGGWVVGWGNAQMKWELGQGQVACHDAHSSASAAASLSAARCAPLLATEGVLPSAVHPSARDDIPTCSFAEGVCGSCTSAGERGEAACSSSPGGTTVCTYVTDLSPSPSVTLLSSSTAEVPSFSSCISPWGRSDSSRWSLSHRLAYLRRNICGGYLWLAYRKATHRSSHLRAVCWACVLVAVG